LTTAGACKKLQEQNKNNALSAQSLKYTDLPSIGKFPLSSSFLTIKISQQ
jgi:hypothetical protein